MDSGQQETQNPERGALSSQTDPWDQNPHSLHLGHLEQNLIQQFEV
jgi:hypothetical protein